MSGDVSMTDILGDDVFVFIPTTPLSKDEREKQTDIVEGFGGLVAKSINKKTTLIVCDNYSDHQSEIDKGVESFPSVKVVTCQFILDCKEKGVRLNPDDYLLSNSGKNKRKDTESTDAGGDGDESAKKSAKVEHLEEDSVWFGSMVYKTGDTYPCYVNISKINTSDLTFEGTMEWPDYDNAKTKIRGQISSNGEKLNWEEYEFIVKSDQMEVPSNYEATVSLLGRQKKPAIVGKVVYKDEKDQQDDDLQADFTLSKQKTNSTPSKVFTTSPLAGSTSIAPPAFIELPWLIPGTGDINGELAIEYPFNLKVTKRAKSSEVDGWMEWTGALNTKTKFKGVLDNQNFTFIEYEVISGDGVQLPVDYKGKLNTDNDQISGTYPYGKFELNLKN